MLQACRESLDRRGGAGGEYFDPSILEIARVAAQAEFNGLLSRPCAECDALHATRHEEARGLHRVQSLRASIARASWAPVTGPRNRPATVPSGAISQVVGRPRGTSKSAGGS